ncbi:MAG: phosphoribosylaminoimidazolesuccinocarboxamide synthase [Cardiobacteriaceae bacterium]|nr:phosphoribosylaminoimidazolesuccinocarboxamide synthase [Cardiobacteriaceae bacterium]
MKKELIYTGKAKAVFATDKADEVIIHYNDDATAGNGAKHEIIADKGILNCAITALIYQELNRAGINTHFVEKLSEREQLCKKVEIVPLEVIVRNVIAGSMAKRLGIEEGTIVREPILEFCYKNDALGDPLINDDHAVAINAANREEIAEIRKQAMAVNQVLIRIFSAINIRLIDFKIEFGRTAEGKIILADEISPDTCRLWNASDNSKMDKDRFRRDLGGLTEAYQEVLARLKKSLGDV